MAAVAEGKLGQATSIPDMAKKALAVIAEDVPAVLADLGGMAFEQGSNYAINIGAEKVKDFISDVGRRGLKASWATIMNEYKRGVEAKHGARKSGSR